MSLPSAFPTSFNPHSRKGSDDKYIIRFSLVKRFNPHSRKGSDYHMGAFTDKTEWFQSTLPQGE